MWRARRGTPGTEGAGGRLRLDSGHHTEFDGHLHDRCRWVEQAGGRLLGPASALVALASDKHATAEYLSTRGVAVPRALPWRLASRCRRIRVSRGLNRDGAGSQGVFRIENASDVSADASRPRRLETFCPGTAASVACLCGPRDVVPLVPCRQRLSDDGCFAYSGGSLPLAPEFATRSAWLARRTVAALPQPLGYLGVDLVLGDDTAGGEDFVIEINPRLTTSYVGLRACAGDLAGAILTRCRGGAGGVVLARRPDTIRVHGTVFGPAGGRGVSARRQHRVRRPRRNLARFVSRHGPGPGGGLFLLTHVPPA